MSNSDKQLHESFLNDEFWVYSEMINKFQTGAIREKKTTDKGRYDLIPWDVMQELAIHFAEGAEKHGERNWEKGMPVHTYIDSAIRHLSCYMRGMTDEEHLRSALWNVTCAMWTEKHRPEMQDIPSRLEE